MDAKAVLVVGVPLADAPQLKGLVQVGALDSFTLMDSDNPRDVVVGILVAESDVWDWTEISMSGFASRVADIARAFKDVAGVEGRLLLLPKFA